MVCLDLDLRLPAALAAGADFFYRHLLDGDPASNTLSWCWVAGLPTRGKTYAAEAANIAKFTGHRFAPQPDELAADAPALTDEEPQGLPELLPLRIFTEPQPGVPAALLLTEEDCKFEEFPLGTLDIRTAATLAASHLRSPRGVAEHVKSFEAAALRDAASRSGFQTEALREEEPETLADWAKSAGAAQIVMPYTPAGPLHGWLAGVRPLLAERGIALCEWRREWDGLVWPHATAGFFRVKKKIPQILHQAGLS